MPANKNAILRYKAIDNLLCSEDWHTIEDIKTACEEALAADSGKTAKVSRVTVYKDLEVLQKDFEGVRIDKQPGRPVKYRYARDSKTMNGTMVPSQSYADLAYTLEYLESISGLLSVDGTIKKIRRQLDADGEGAQKLISFQTNPRLRNSDMLWSLYRHIREGNPLTLKYNTAYEEVREYDFQPWYLKQYNNRWFLLGWKYTSTDSTDGVLRNLAVDRIVTAEGEKPRINISRKRLRRFLLNTPGSDTYVDFEEYFSDMIGVTRYEDSEPEEITLKADMSLKGGRYDWNRMVTKPVHSSQTSWTEGDSGYIRFKVRPNNELYTVLLGYENLEIVSPEDVRAEMKARVEHILNHYI